MRTPLTPTLTACLFITLGLLAAACTADQSVHSTAAVPIDGASTHTTDAGQIDWGPCDDPSAHDPLLECGSLAVPLDYSRPDGDTIDLAVVRVPATASERVGAVLFNPGGPGGSGFDYIAQAGTTLVSEMGLDGFDLIGFDPRGTR